MPPEVDGREMVHTYLGDWPEDAEARWCEMFDGPDRVARVKSEGYRTDLRHGRIDIFEAIDLHNLACDVARTEVREALRRIASGSAEEILPFVTWLLYQGNQAREWADRLAEEMAPPDVLDGHDGRDKWRAAFDWHRHGWPDPLQQEPSDAEPGGQDRRDEPPATPQ